MSLERIPIVERPVIHDVALENFQVALSGIGFSIHTQPVLRLLLVGEAHTLNNAETRIQVAEEIGQKAVCFSREHTDVTARVLRSRVFMRRPQGKVTHFVGLTLGVDREVGKERADIVGSFENNGVDTTGAPFNKFRFTAVVAEARPFPPGITKQDVYDVIDHNVPAQVTLGRPQLKP